MKTLTKFLLLPIVIAAGVQSASAVEFPFYKLDKADQPGNLPKAGDFVPTMSFGRNQEDFVSSNVAGGTFNGSLEFTSGTIVATATGKHGLNIAAVVQDHQPGWTLNSSAGLGVYHVNPLDTSDDNITADEVLTITFNQVVTLTSIGLRADGHNTTGWTDDSTFAFGNIDNATSSTPFLPKGVSGGLVDLAGLDLTGKVFTFAYGGRKPDQFYLASLTATAVPEGGATLALLGLSTLGLGALRKRFGTK